MSNGIVKRFCVACVLLTTLVVPAARPADAQVRGGAADAPPRGESRSTQPEGGIERWRVVVYADKGDPGADETVREAFWKRAFDNLQANLSKYDFSVSIARDPANLELPLADMAAQLGLLSDRRTGTDSRVWRFHQWQFNVDAPAFESIEVRLGDQVFAIDAKNAKIESNGTPHVHAKSISYPWSVTVPEAPLLRPDVAELNVLLHFADKTTATRQLTVMRTPSDRLQRLVRVRLFDIKTKKAADLTRFLDLFRESADGPSSATLIRGSGEPPILFVPNSKIVDPSVRVALTFTFGSAERIDQLWAREATTNSRRELTPVAQTNWELCKPIGAAEYREIRKEAPAEGEQYFWKVTMKLKPTPPVVFIGRTASGEASAWGVNGGALNALQAAPWLAAEIERLEGAKP